MPKLGTTRRTAGLPTPSSDPRAASVEKEAEKEVEKAVAKAKASRQTHQLRQTKVEKEVETSIKASRDPGLKKFLLTDQVNQ